MADGVEVRSYGRVFNEIADAYDRHRPAYPDALIDRACEVAGLAPGAQGAGDRLRHGPADAQLA